MRDTVANKDNRKYDMQISWFCYKNINKVAYEKCLKARPYPAMKMRQHSGIIGRSENLWTLSFFDCDEKTKVVCFQQNVCSLIIFLMNFKNKQLRLMMFEFINRSVKFLQYTYSSRIIPCQVIQQNGDFSSDPHRIPRNFIRGKISGFWAQQSWNFWKQTCISKIMSIWNFDILQEDWTEKFLEFCCWNFNWLSLLYLWIFSFKILQ